MKVQELRIGNWIMIPYQNAPIAIPAHKTEVQGITIFGEVLTNNTPEHEGLKTHFNHISGIPITEEWLLKFGFECWLEKPNGGFYVLHNVIDGTSDFEVTLEGGEAYPSIDENCIYWGKTLYVHQLQNLYFALTGNELTIEK